MRHLKPLFFIALVGGCESEPVAAPAPECTPNSFRACETDADCRGVQQCVEPGNWSICSCALIDGSFADAAPDATPADAASEDDGG